MWCNTLRYGLTPWYSKAEYNKYKHMETFHSGISVRLLYCILLCRMFPTTCVFRVSTQWGRHKFLKVFDKINYGNTYIKVNNVNQDNKLTCLWTNFIRNFYFNFNFLKVLVWCIVAYHQKAKNTGVPCRSLVLKLKFSDDICPQGSWFVNMYNKV